MSIHHKSIDATFPTPMAKFKISNNDELKEMYLDRIIQSYENEEYEIPEGWFTKSICTSHALKQIIEPIPEVYMECLNECIAEEWTGDVYLWHNVIKNGEYQEVHNHLPSFLSAIHFLQFDKNEHDLPVFVDPGRGAKYPRHHVKTYLGSEPYFLPDVEEGDIIVFPSYLDHFISGGKYDRHRVTVSFNLTLN